MKEKIFLMKTYFKIFFNLYRYFKINNDNKKIVLFLEKLEDIVYFSIFLQDIYKHLKIKTLILFSSNENNDQTKALKYISDSIFIGSGLVRYLIFRLIDAKVFFMTTPDLGNSELQKSINKVKYIYLFHSIVSSHMIYNFKSFDNYDLVLSTGPHHDKEIRHMEKVYSSPLKKIMPFGYPRLIEFNKKYNLYNNTFKKKNKTILIAPTWGEWSITEICLENLLKVLIKSNYNIIYRPHPKSLIDKKIFMEKIKKDYKNKVTFQEGLSDMKFLKSVDLLISDWSGFALEFYLVTRKQIIFVDTPPKIKNKKFEDLKIVPLEKHIRKKIGHILPLKSISNVNVLVEKILRKTKVSKKNIEIIYNYKKNIPKVIREIDLILKED